MIFPPSSVHTHPAVTLIELIFVITILAIITVSMLVGLPRIQARMNFQNETESIKSLFEEARSKGLQSKLVEGQAGAFVEYYELELGTEALTLKAVASDGTEEELQALTLDEGHQFASGVSFYFFPPEGDLCVNTFDYPNCLNPESTDYQAIVEVTLQDPENQLEAHFSISTLGRTIQVE